MPDFSHPAIAIEPLEIDLPSGWRISSMSFVPSENGRGWSAWAVSPSCETSALLMSGALHEEHPVAEEHREGLRRLFLPHSELEDEEGLTPFEKRERLTELSSHLRDIMPEERPGANPDHEPVISPDGRRMSYVVQTSNDVKTLFFDGRPIRTWGSVHDMGYSPDSRRFFAIFRKSLKPRAAFGDVAAEIDEESDLPTSEEFLLVDIDTEEAPDEQPKSLGCLLHDGKEVAHYASFSFLSPGSLPASLPFTAVSRRGA